MTTFARSFQARITRNYIERDQVPEVDVGAAMRQVLIQHWHHDHQLSRLGIDKADTASHFLHGLQHGPSPELAWGPRGLLGLAQLCESPKLGARLRLSLATLRHLVTVPEATPDVVQRMWTGLRNRITRRPALVTARLAASDQVGITGLLQSGFEFIGGELVGILRVLPAADRGQSHEHPRVVPLDRTRHMEAVAHLAATCHTHNQYAYQSRLSRAAAAEIYRDLVVAQAKESDTEIMVALDDDDKVQGFITFKVNRTLEAFVGRRLGTLDFIAVSPDARTRGLGDALNRAALERLGYLQVDAVTVRTMITNYPALAVLRKIGFEITSSNIILHRWLA